jgi:hypothetical protein
MGQPVAAPAAASELTDDEKGAKIACLRGLCAAGAINEVQFNTGVAN